MSTREVPVSDNKPFVKYKVLCSEKYGRYLIAGKKINTGEVIIREKPLVVGPHVFNENHLCFECLKMIPTCATKGNSDISCSNCRVAIFCCVACKAQKFHHTFEECEILKNKTISFNVNEILLPLRLWLIKKKDEKLWEKILCLEAHLEARRDTDKWKHRDEDIINKLKSLGIVDESEENNFSELFHRIFGILEVNSFELPVLDGPVSSRYCGLYLEASLIAHDCRGNTFWTCADKFQMTIHASKPIDDGEMILLTYTSPFLGTADRQAWLRESKYFECDCSMCEDPYELGTNLSTMLCPYCPDGLITFASETTKNPYVKEKNWKCNKCEISLSGYLIAFYLYLVRMRIEPIKKSIKESEILLEKLSSIFHPNHFLMLGIKHKLFFLYKIESPYSDLSSKRLKRIIEIGTDVLDTFEIERPGISCFKGVLLHNMYGIILCSANLHFSTGQISPEEFMKQWEKAKKYLKRSLTMLLYAPETSNESILAKKALEEYKLLCQHKN